MTGLCTSGVSECVSQKWFIGISVIIASFECVRFVGKISFSYVVQKNGAPMREEDFTNCLASDNFVTPGMATTWFDCKDAPLTVSRDKMKKKEKKVVSDPLPTAKLGWRP